MKTLLLTSDGLDGENIRKEVVKILPRSANQIKLAHIITASKSEKNTSYVKRDKQEMSKMGFQVEDIDVEGKSEDELRDLLKDKDVIYVQGGNGFYLLKHVKKSGFDKITKGLVKKGVIYIGVSAGSYVACPTIEMHTWKDEERNRFGLTDLTAMNLVPFLVTAHYNRLTPSEKQELREKASRSDYSVRAINDDQALLVKNGKVKFVGKGKEVIIK